MSAATRKCASRRGPTGGVTALLVGLFVVPVAGAAEGTDQMSPTIEHRPVAEAPPGKAVVIRARITDPSGVALPRLYFRSVGQREYSGVPLAAASRPGEFVGTIPGLAVISAGVEYYLEAFDAAGNGPAHSGTAEQPHRILVVEPAASRPLVVAPVTPATQPARSRWYKTWWFWTAVGAVIAGSVTAAVAVASGGDEPHSIRVNAPLPQPGVSQ